MDNLLRALLIGIGVITMTALSTVIVTGAVLTIALLLVHY